MSNKSIIKVLENAGGVESEKVGYGFNEIPITHLSWVLLAWKVKVIKRPIYNEEIKITTWAREANKVFTYRDFEIYNEKDEEIKTTLQEVYDALQEKGYNPINQIIGYILSEDPTYITTHRDARKKIRNLDRDDILQSLLRNYLK